MAQESALSTEGDKLSTNSTLDSPRPGLRVLVVGAGLGGLSVAIALSLQGHKVTVFEKASEIREIGAGIQLPSNATLLLRRWGLEPILSSKLDEPRAIYLHRWQNGSLIGRTRLYPEFREAFNSPYYLVHRSDLHDALHKRALHLGVQVKASHTVVKYDATIPSLTLASGTTETADLIIAADGINSIARAYVDPNSEKPLETGFVSYRATITADKLEGDPTVSWLLSESAQHLWIGPGSHLMSYRIVGGKALNLVFCRPQGHRSDPKRQEGDLVEELRHHFSEWDPTVTRLIDKINTTMKRPLLRVETKNWLSSSGNLLLLGDAAHAMPPFMSQGAAMAFEDSAALALAIGSCPAGDPSLCASLRGFEKVRKRRVAQMQLASLKNGVTFHLPDGPEQRARDEGMRPEVEGAPFAKSPNLWSDPDTQVWVYGYDAEKDMKENQV